MPLLVVGFPELAPEDAGWIRSIREQDKRLGYSILAPHFTVVFPLSTVSENQLAGHIGKQLAGCRGIEFVLRSSLLVKDDSSDDYYVLLVPDEGFGSIVKLHDKLYRGMLAPALRLDIPFIPHITVGYSADTQACKALVDSINQEEFAIKGKISGLDLIKKEADRVWTVKHFPFR
jgi:2'-5' RNA ligase